jgi:signal transduction histidine kinase/CheY-like chemotaxis protein/HPt (histidine-containing phosphotransfer) domain-containing protein
VIRYLFSAWCWLLLLAAGPLRAQPVFLRQFGVAEGLSQPFIYALQQDAQGYLWLGTAEGLVRYDGSRFVTFTKKDGLAEDFTTGLWLDPKTSQLWARHYEGSISTKAPSNEHFTRSTWAAAPARWQGLATGTPTPDTATIGCYRRRYHLQLPAEVVITCLLEDREGNTWLGTAGQGLWRHSDRYLRLAPPLPTYTLRAPRLPAGTEITAETYSPTSGRWVGTAADGLYLLPEDQSQPLRHFTTANGLLHNTITALLADRTGRIWVGTHGTGLAAYEPHAGTFEQFRLNRTGVDVSSFLEDARGNLWVGTEGQGLYCYRAGGQWHHFDEATGLPSNYVYGLLALPHRGAASRLLLVHRQSLTQLSDASTGPIFSPLASPDNPLVHDLLPVPTHTHDSSQAFIRTRTGTLILDAQALPAATPAPGLALTRVEVDGERQPTGQMGQLTATRHHLDFTFQGISLSAGAPLHYQYRLLGLADAWSRPGSVGEAQFPGLDAGDYRLEVRVRRGDTVPWSTLMFKAFSIATPFWRRWWFGVLAVAGILALGVAIGRLREGQLRQQQLVLERTVRERTTELRQQKSHIEQINGDLILARDAAEASQRAKAQFLANMSHEIRTPMNAVIGLTNLLQATHPTTEQGEYLTAIESSSQNLLVIINDILDSSKMEAGKLTLEQVPFRLLEAVRRLETMFHFATESKGLFFNVSIASAVPAAVLGDPVRLNQILVNLVGNAIKFTRQGGVTVTVEMLPVILHNFSPPTTHQTIRFAVRDTGIGIPADKLGAIFEDFSQANASTTREFGGTGLGLSIARNLVQLHGGQLGVTSEEGQGSEFFFEIAYEEADANAARPEAQHGQLQPFEPALRVLVAEDNDLNQLVARKTLEAWNVQVVIAANGRLAVEAATTAAQPFDAVLMDVQMPEMDGYEATRLLRQQFPNVQEFPIIGLTASVLPEDRVLALTAGMNDTLAKPFEPAVLYARLAHLTGRGNAPSNTSKRSSPSEKTHHDAPVHPSFHHARPDWQLLEELAGGNDAFLRQIVQTFLNEAPAQEALLTVNHADNQELARLAHKLKGQVSYFGMPGLCAQLDELERATHHPACPHCAPLIASIQQQLGVLYPQLQERV